MILPSEVRDDKSAYFILRDSEERDAALAFIKDNFKLSHDGSKDVEWIFLDTFDHRLYKNGYSLSKEGDRYVLCQPGHEPDITLPCEGTGDRPLFWGDFPEGPFRDALRPLTDVRAIIPLVRIEGSLIRENVINEDDKTVSHISAQDFQVSENGSDGKGVRLIEVAAVRGYADEFDYITEKLGKAGFERAEGNLFSVALALTGGKPGAYSSKPNYNIGPDTPAGEALRIIF
ncbi:MAG TPA: hypothetical protein VHC46_00325, partial [Thermodesulfobacteriota bacterium]|nr:hypothetical protein [Thermodesulfobacteriota bacterium]